MRKHALVVIYPDGVRAPAVSNLSRARCLVRHDCVLAHDRPHLSIYSLKVPSSIPLLVQYSAGMRGNAGSLGSESSWVAG